MPQHSIHDHSPERNSLPNVTVPLNDGSLLCFRRRILRARSHPRCDFQRSGETRTACQESQGMETAPKTKEERRMRHAARVSHDQTAKLRRLRERYVQLCERRCEQLQIIKMRMREEKRIFEHQQELFFAGGAVLQDMDKKSLPMLILLAVSSPLWMAGLSLRALLGKIWTFFVDHRGRP